MPRRAPERFDPAELAHRLRGPLNNMLLWSAVLAQQLRQAPATVQRALEGLQQAVRDEADIVASLLEHGGGRETSGTDQRSDPDRPRPRSPP